jgi:hypothetical protein
MGTAWIVAASGHNQQQSSSAATYLSMSTLESESTVSRDTSHELLLVARRYQQEMLAESLRRNIVIAMDTGSGKTHIAVLRIKHETERESRKVCERNTDRTMRCLRVRLVGLLVSSAYRCIVRTAERRADDRAIRVRGDYLWISRA